MAVNVQSCFFVELESLSFDCPKKKKKVYPLIEKKNVMAQKVTA